MRGKEIDCSWPSGDTAQATIIAFFIIMNMPDVLAKVPGGTITMFLWIAHVAFARVFFQCHYIGDTLGAVIVGGFVSAVNTYITRMCV